MLVLASCLLTFYRSSLRNLLLPLQTALFTTLKMPRSKGGAFNSIQFVQVDRKDVLFIQMTRTFDPENLYYFILEEGHTPCFMNSVLKISLLISL